MELRLDIGYDRKKPLLAGLVLSFESGDIINIVGDNGCGKSTLYKTIAGTLPPLKGSIPRDVIDRCSLISDKISPPSEVLVSDLTALVESDFSGRINSISPLIASSVNHLRDCRVSTLSTGQRRLLEISLALASGKRILVLDEAFSGLDCRSREACLEAIKSLNGVTIFNTSHNLEDPIALGGKILFLDASHSRLVEYGGARTVECLRQFMVSMLDAREGD